MSFVKYFAADYTDKHTALRFAAWSLTYIFLNGPLLKNAPMSYFC
jgi:hypothetical protein